MFSLNVRGILVLASGFFKGIDREGVLAAIPQGTRRVVFIDTPAKVELVATIETLVSRGIEVVVRDHHDEPSPKNSRGEEIRSSAQRVRDLVGANATISHRGAHPACSSLIQVGEFAEEGTILVIDPDLDGLTAGMKAAGVYYPELDNDADVLDGGRAGQTAERLSPNAFLLVRAMASLPAFDAARPQASEDAKAKLFTDFVAVVQGDSDAKTRLERGVEVYEEGVRQAERLAETVTDLMPGVASVDLMTSPRFDLTTLAGKMESRPGVRVTVQKKPIGPICNVEKAAGRPAVQYSLAVAKAEQANVNLQELLPAGFISSPETGIISNTTFLLHVSEKVWNETVLPALRAKFGG